LNPPSKSKMNLEIHLPIEIFIAFLSHETFCLGSFLSHRTFCFGSFFVPRYILFWELFLSLGTFCFGTLFVPWDVLFWELFCSMERFVLELFVPSDILFWGHFLHCWTTKNSLVFVKQCSRPAASLAIHRGGGWSACTVINPKSDNCSISACSSANYTTG
jgi:hypothetical protein